MDPAEVLGEILECARSRSTLPELHLSILSGLRKIAGWDSAIFVPTPSRNEPVAQVNKERFIHLVPQILHARRFVEDKERMLSAAQKNGGLCIDTELYSAYERRNLPFFAEVMRPQGITSRICIALDFGGTQTATIHLCRHSQVCNFSSNDLENLRPLIAGITVADTARARASTPRLLGDEAELTPREHEIVDYVCRGLRTRDVALCLGTSPKTVSNQLQRVFDKLGISSRAELVARVLGSRS
jgi:DNA-binding CsgD family transcriptional regulator